MSKQPALTAIPYALVFPMKRAIMMRRSR